MGTWAPLGAHQLPVVWLWVPTGYSLGSCLGTVWVPVQFPLDIQWILSGFSSGSHWVPIEFPLDNHCVLIGFPVGSHGVSIRCSLGFYWVFVGFPLGALRVRGAHGTPMGGGWLCPHKLHQGDSALTLLFSPPPPNPDFCFLIFFINMWGSGGGGALPSPNPLHLCLSGWALGAVTVVGTCTPGPPRDHASSVSFYPPPLPLCTPPWQERRDLHLTGTTTARDSGGGGWAEGGTGWGACSPHCTLDPAVSRDLPAPPPLPPRGYGAAVWHWVPPSQCHGVPQELPAAPPPHGGFYLKNT